MDKKTILIVGLTNLDVKMELEKINLFHKNVLLRNANFFKTELTVETGNILYKGVSEKSLSNLDGYICKEFILTPLLLKSKPTNELIKIIDFCKIMIIKHKR